MSSLVAPVTTVELLLRMARSYDWVRETQGANKGEVVNRFLKNTALGPGYPWCAAFVASIGTYAFGADWPLPHTASCQQLADAAQAKSMLMKFPTPGAVFLLWGKSEGRYHHTGFVQGPQGAGWKTVEGNTNEDGSPEGTGVFERVRIFAPLDRFVWWWAGEARAA